MHPIYKVDSFEIIAPYKLSIKFDDGLTRVIDFRNISKGELYGPLSDLQFFNQVKLDKEIHTLVWPNGADFDPLTFHDWDKYETEFRLMIENFD